MGHSRTLAASLATLAEALPWDQLTCHARDEAAASLHSLVAPLPSAAFAVFARVDWAALLEGLVASAAAEESERDEATRRRGRGRLATGRGHGGGERGRRRRRRRGEEERRPVPHARSAHPQLAPLLRLALEINLLSPRSVSVPTRLALLGEETLQAAGGGHEGGEGAARLWSVRALLPSRRRRRRQPARRGGAVAHLSALHAGVCRRVDGAALARLVDGSTMRRILLGRVRPHPSSTHLLHLHHLHHHHHLPLRLLIVHL